MKMPPKDDLELAAEWLRHYEGEPEGSRCRAVAEWLEHMTAERELRTIARENGVTVSRLRRKIAERDKSESAL